MSGKRWFPRGHFQLPGVRGRQEEKALFRISRDQCRTLSTASQHRVAMPQVQAGNLLLPVAGNTVALQDSPGGFLDLGCRLDEAERQRQAKDGNHAFS